MKDPKHPQEQDREEAIEKDSKLSSNDISEEKAENTEVVTEEPRINTNGL
ncbi:hypothetical protein [Paenisporosarcina cavernae]|nr:hypothetical protein [Paenisporosarcina cavernae]